MLHLHTAKVFRVHVGTVHSPSCFKCHCSVWQSIEMGCLVKAWQGVLMSRGKAPPHTGVHYFLCSSQGI